MRPDMKDIIIEVYRRGRGYSKTSESARARLKREDPQNLPKFLSNRFIRNSEPNDRLAPLEKFFQANVGRPWNDVYSEIREHCDTRNSRGQHLWEHVISDVHPPYPSSYKYGAYIDDDGLLRYAHRPKYPRPEPVLTHITVDYQDYYHFVKYDEWFELIPSIDEPKHKAGWVPPPAQWYRMKRYVETYNIWEYKYNGTKKVPVRLKPYTRETLTKHQVGKNTLRKIRQYKIRKAIEKLQSPPGGAY